MRVDHVGIAVENLEEAILLYTESMHLEVAHQEEVPSQHVRVAFLADKDLPSPRTSPQSQGKVHVPHPMNDQEAVRSTQIELLEPTGDEGAIAKFIKKHGPGMHHVAFHAGEVAPEMKRLAGLGRPPLEEAARPGARGHNVCFLHPKHCCGVLVELVGK